MALFHGKTPLCHWPLDPGFPELDNRDAGNPGKGQYVVTWRATLPAPMVLGNVVESVQVVDKEGQPVVTETFPVPILKPEGVQLLVYVNEHVLVR